MLGTIQHVFSNAIADGTNTQIVRPSDWNSAHNVTLSMQSNDHPVFSAGTSTAYLSSVVFSNASGVLFGLNGSTITASVATNYQSQGAYLTTAALSQDSSKYAGVGETVGTTAGTDLALTVDTAGVSIGYPKWITTARASTDAIGLGTAQTNVTWTVNSAGISFNAGGYNGTGFTSTSTAGVDIQATNNTSGLSMAVPAYITTARRSTDAVGLNTAQTNVTWTVNSSGISFNAGGYNGTGFTSTTTAGTAIVATNNTAGLSMAVPAFLTAAGGAVTVSRFNPVRHITGNVATSVAPASWFFNVFTVPNHVAVNCVEFAKSINVGVPAATSLASTGTARFSYAMGMTLFKRQDFGANSSNMSYWTSASFGMTAGVSHSSTSQSFIFSYVTDSTGGTTSFNTTSNAANWSTLLNSNRIIRMPLVTTLAPGEYFMAINHSSTSGTTNSNVTLLSVSDRVVQFASQAVGILGQSVVTGLIVDDYFAGIAGVGSASAVTTNNTMAISVVTNGTNQWFPQFAAYSAS